MCCFSRHIDAVKNTRIFGRVAGREQLLVYEMKLAAPHELAMVLPIPVVPGGPEDAVRFINLEAYPDLFDDLDRSFPATDLDLGDKHAMAARPLVVHDVGAFEASYVPTIRDFARVDARFRLPDQVWSALPGYRDFGFAVFKLKPASNRMAPIHPMAFGFPTRDPRTVFFPTVHIHDGQVHDRADFDHALYAQGITGTDWEHSEVAADERVELSRAGGVIQAGARCQRKEIRGQRLNQDFVIPLR